MFRLPVLVSANVIIKLNILFFREVELHQLITVKPVLRGHLWAKEKVAL